MFFSPSIALILAVTEAASEACSRLYANQPREHSDAQSGEYKQKYYVCSEHYTPGGPMFFYTGNESPVELYLENTGFMWESAPAFGALLVFAEHRYYGESQLFDACDTDRMQYLTADQAMRDYVRLIKDLKSEHSTGSVITFGGSYGGMLSAYMRMQYPDIVQGAIAGSTPVFSLTSLSPRPDAFAFNAVIARAAEKHCSKKLREAYTEVFGMSQSAYDYAELGKKFNTCSGLSKHNIKRFIEYISEPWGDLAMGDYPFSSNYITGGESGTDAPYLPAYPLGVACGEMEKYSDRLIGLREAIGVYYNASGTLGCFFGDHEESSPQIQCGSWEYQYCAEFMMPFSSGGLSDFFYPFTPFHLQEAVAKCERKFPGLDAKASTRYGGYEGVASASKIFFTNGDLDPWGAWGVDCSVHACGDDVTSRVIKGGAHHLELMFSNEHDPVSVVEVREEARDAIRRWIGVEDVNIEITVM